MASNKFLTGVMAVAATISVAALAGCPGNTPGPVGPSATPSGTPSGTPSTTPNPSESPSTPAPTALPSSADTQSVATVRGFIEDEDGNRLDGVTVTAKVLASGINFANGSDSLTVTSVNGSYVLNGAPTGVIVEVVASKAGYGERRLALTPLANTTGQGSVNDLNFTGKDALTDKPQILSINPGDKTTGVEAAASFTITFSAPMDKKSVEDKFRIAFNKDAKPADMGGLFAASTEQKLKAGSMVYDASYFTPEWSANNTVLTLTWQNENHLITDKDSGDVPEYAIFFLSGVKTAAGTEAKASSDNKDNDTGAGNTNHNQNIDLLGFRLAVGGATAADNTTISQDIFRVGTAAKSKVTFTVGANNTKPRVDRSLVTAGSQGEKLKVRLKFNKRMELSTLAGSFRGGAAFNTLTTAGSYAYSWKAGEEANAGQADPAGTPAPTINFYELDPTKKTLEFTGADNTVAAGKTTFGAMSLFISGSTIKAESAVKDPAGNDVDSDYNEGKGTI